MADKKQNVEMTGYEKLKASVIRDCESGGDCRTFNPEGCDKSRCTCFHRYCDKFKWVVDRAKLYAQKTGLDWQDILSAWERDRSYWYMNFYQECNQPGFNEDDEIHIFETLEEAKKAFGSKGFRCPQCGKASEDPVLCNHCGWAMYGLVPSKGVYVFAKDRMSVFHIYKPVEWEQKEKKE